MIAAIYSRKSIFTGKGESIENQINLCKEYAQIHLDVEEFLIYEDEGYSGGNINRPKFKELIKDIKNKKINVLICYRLDRISRNVADFSSTLEVLQSNKVDFISIKEQFDTTNPMGRAMIYISSVFAQLERETIAERVKDNMLQLAKTGRWLGGQEPLGYYAERVVYFDEELKEKSLMHLKPIAAELDIVRIIFSKYLELHSINQVVIYLNFLGIKGKNGGVLATMQVRKLLSNPLYVKSSVEAENYLINIGMNVFGKPNGNGYLTYNKTKNIVTERDIKEWIAAIGNHPGIIETDMWLEVQQVLNSNKNKKLPRLGTGDTNALLAGILKCSKCNSNMIIKQGHISKTNENIRYDYYSCGNKNNSLDKKCNNKNIRVDILDRLVLKELSSYNKELLIEELHKLIENEIHSNPLEGTSQSIENDILEKKSIIDNLIKQLSLNKNDQVAKYIFTEIEKKHIEILELQNKMLSSKKNEPDFKNALANSSMLLSAFNTPYSQFEAIKNIKLKRTIIKSIVSNALWDGDKNLIQVFYT